MKVLGIARLLMLLGASSLLFVGVSIVRAADTAPPWSQSISVSPATIPLGGSAVVTARITDDQTGVAANPAPQITYKSPIGQAVRGGPSRSSPAPPSTARGRPP